MKGIITFMLAAAFAAVAAAATDCTFAIDCSNAPELREWCENDLRPELAKWYDRFCTKFPTKGWTPPAQVRIRFKEGMKVPAYATHPGNTITLNLPYFKKRPSLGCVMHELFHIVQHYRKTPSWVTEAMADYARFYFYANSPKSCAVDSLAGNVHARSKYRTGANFLNFVETAHPETLVKLNDVCRRGKYDEASFWKGATGKTLDELEDDWKGRRHAAEAPALRVMNYNIRNSQGDRKTENDWKARQVDFAHVIERENPDLLALQEVLPDQRQWLERRFADFTFSGEGRNADRKSGESSPVAFRKSRFELIKDGTFWLSETPDEPGSKSWDAALPRICSYVVLKDKETGGTFSFANTHTDHKSERAREKGMLLVIERMNEFGKGAPIIFTGDHNCLEFEKPALAVKKILKDSLYLSATAPQGPWRTCTHWAWRDKETTIAEALKKPVRARSKKGDDAEHIDYIYVSPGTKVFDYRIVDSPRPGKKLYPSDHFPSVTTIKLPGR